MPKISVVVPVYNTEKYLRECVDSILNQTVQDIEVILVDDGSPDNCPAICDAYAAMDNRVKVVHKENGGLSSARNAGIKAAVGEWIAFVDSDDVIEPDMYETMLDAAENGDVSLVIAGTSILKGTQKYPILLEREHTAIEIVPSSVIIERLWSSEYDNNLFTAPWNKLYHRRKLQHLLWFCENIIYEDDELANRLYVNDFMAAIVYRPMYCWRMTPGSITHQSFSEKNCIMLSHLYERAQVFLANGHLVPAQKTSKVFLELYIEYYYKSLAAQHPEWVLKYRTTYQKMKGQLAWKGMLKHRVRYKLFELSPGLYRRILSK